jgi:hypothetical protein
MFCKSFSLNDELILFKNLKFIVTNLNTNDISKIYQLIINKINVTYSHFYNTRGPGKTNIFPSSYTYTSYNTFGYLRSQKKEIQQ